MRSSAPQSFTNSDMMGRVMGKQSESFTPYDSADYLTGIEDVAAYLEAAIEEAGDDPTFIAQALGTIARSSNNSELARRVGMSREGLYKAQRKGPLTSAFAGQRPFACIPTGYAWRLISDASPGSRHQASHLRKRRSSVSMSGPWDASGSSCRRAPGRNRQPTSDLHLHRGQGSATATDQHSVVVPTARWDFRHPRLDECA